MNRFLIAYRYRYPGKDRWTYIEAYAYLPDRVDIGPWLVDNLADSEILHVSGPHKEYRGVWGGTFTTTKTSLQERGLIGG